MAKNNERQRAAAVCENCGTAHAVRIESDGEIQPIGTGQGSACTCENGNLRIMSNDSNVLNDVNSK